MPTEHQIAELNFKNTEQLPDIPLERKAIFDISCISTTGQHFIVEMQKAKLQFFKDRSVFYVTFPIRDQAKKGDWLSRSYMPCGNAVTTCHVEYKQGQIDTEWCLIPDATRLDCIPTCHVGTRETR
ncbi:hypothetical protein TPSD3_03815 [Thioflexithrix psekupsensis]|uniref:Uncharacterized protein n=1 Tax=Thioflexithrix psekupsensis TaxID=1570016 RepID=A0A251XC85_9GAMM|nr:Rpn family recombination-promoting nuclease/putative transposase [Thioflexithrix psekupsensis]OUD15656.1 hypothetical protein TPSD3_03815 [Thioflexithrix psekupsensis]